MASRLHRKDAGRQVATAMDQLSDSLLAHEEETQLAMEAVFVRALPAVVQLVSSLHGKSNRQRRMGAREVVTLAREAMAATAPLYRSLGDISVSQGLSSIRKELLICERSLAQRYAGLADSATNAVQGRSALVGDIGEAQYRANVETMLGWLQVRIESELATGRDDDVEAFIARVVSPTPLKDVTDHHGRGLWWKALEHCNRVCRETQFATMNGVRGMAMTEFNTQGEDR